MKTSPYSNDQYTVGWISTLSNELMVAMAMLDEDHGRPQGTPREDINAYHLGRIGDHKVVMTSISGGKTGTAPTATVAENLRRTFKNIRFAFLVGAGGGVPGKSKDIRLGDVVVSYPHKTYTGVVQYDWGTLNGDGNIERKDWFYPPPNKVLAAVDLLTVYHSRPKNPMNNMSTIMDELGEKYRYPNEDEAEDRLYKADYAHNPGGRMPCDMCNMEYLILRGDRNPQDKPRVHYGVIASGNMVIRNGVERDRIDHRYNNSILCLDTAAAGLMNNIPSLVIQGISNYSDSHSNNKWENRAVAAASAYAKELLFQIEPPEVPPVTVTAGAFHAGMLYNL